MTSKQKKKSERNEKILNMYKRNRPVKEIAESCFVSTATVYKVVNKLTRPSKAELKVSDYIELNNRRYEILQERLEYQKMEFRNEIRCFVHKAESSELVEIIELINRIKYRNSLKDSKKGGDSYECNTYIMIDNRNGLHKIGKTKKHPSYRERTLQSEVPQISLEFYCKSDIEKDLHKKYRDKRVRGEWFSLSELDIENIKRLMGKVCYE